MIYYSKDARGKNKSIQVFKEEFFTFVDTTKPSEVHLVRAVEDNDILSQSLAHVLGGLCLACPSRAGRGTTHAHTQGLGQGDVTSTQVKQETQII